jgi:adenine-specific DNA-methyltransferase
MNKAQNNNFSQKLKNHLKVLFQFDSAELDFGIYRIMNYKRKEIANLLQKNI